MVVSFQQSLYLHHNLTMSAALGEQTENNTKSNSLPHSSTTAPVNEANEYLVPQLSGAVRIPVGSGAKSAKLEQSAVGRGSGGGEVSDRSAAGRPAVYELVELRGVRGAIVGGTLPEQGEVKGVVVGAAEYEVVELSGVGGAGVGGAKYLSGVKSAVVVGAEYEVVGLGGAVPEGPGAAYQILDQSKVGGAVPEGGGAGYQTLDQSKVGGALPEGSGVAYQIMDQSKVGGAVVLGGELDYQKVEEPSKENVKYNTVGAKVYPQATSTNEYSQLKRK